MAKVKKDQRKIKLGRPEKLLDWNRVDALLRAGCHGTEVAARFDMDPKTFYRKVEEEFKITFTEYSAQKKADGDANIREIQYLRAIGEVDKGDNTMLVWLGKNRLSQKESSEVSVSPETFNAYSKIMSQVDEMQSERKKMNQEKLESA